MDEAEANEQLCGRIIGPGSLEKSGEITWVEAEARARAAMWPSQAIGWRVRYNPDRDNVGVEPRDGAEPAADSGDSHALCLLHPYPLGQVDAPSTEDGEAVSIEMVTEVGDVPAVGG